MATRSLKEILVPNLIVGSAYFIAGLLCLFFSTGSSYTSPVWIPSGIALASVLLLGPRVLPAVALGSALSFIEVVEAMGPRSNFWNILIQSVPVGLATALQTWVAASLIRKLVGWPNPLIHGREVMKFLVLGGPVSCVIASTMGVLTLRLTGMITPDQTAFEWFTWYVGDSLGVILITPIILSFFAKPRDLWRRRTWVLGVPLTITLILSGLAFHQTRAYEDATLQTRFAVNAKLIVERFQDELQLLDRLPSVLRTHQLLTPKGRPAQKEFKEIAQTFMAIHPKIFAISWVDLVPEQERKQYERLRSAESGRPRFKIWEFGPRGNRIPAARRDKHLVIRMTYAGSQGADYSGFDTASHLENKKKPLPEIQNHRAAAVPNIPLLGSEKPGQAAMLIYNPVFKDGDKIVGFVTIVVRLEQIICDATAPFFENRNEFAVKVLTEPSAELVFQRGNEADPKHLDPGYKFETSVGLEKVSRAHWSVQVLPTDEYLRRIRPIQSWSVLIGSLLICGFLAGFLLILAGHGEIQRKLANRLSEEFAAKEKAYENIRRLENDLSRVWRVNTVGELATSLAHELSQPLASIRNYTQGILSELRSKGHDNRDLEESVREISKEAERAGNFIQSLRAFISGKEPVRKIKTLNAIVTEIMALFDHELNAQHVKFTVDLTPRDTTIAVERIQVGQVFLNLLRNAVESMTGNDPDDRFLSVKTSVETDGFAMVSFVDNGCGIDEKDLKQVFEPFYTTKSSGMGMGLAISKTVIEAHGGQLGVTRNAVRGTTFYVKLPQVTETKK